MLHEIQDSASAQIQILAGILAQGFVRMPNVRPLRQPRSQSTHSGHYRIRVNDIRIPGFYQAGYPHTRFSQDASRGMGTILGETPTLDRKRYAIRYSGDRARPEAGPSSEPAPACEYLDG